MLGSVIAQATAKAKILFLIFIACMMQTQVEFATTVVTTKASEANMPPNFKRKFFM
jgi:hypothetical protein